MPTIEEPPRLAAQLEKLARGLLALGLDHASTVQLCRRAALDFMPQERRAGLEVLASGEAVFRHEKRWALGRASSEESRKPLAGLSCPMDAHIAAPQTGRAVLYRPDRDIASSGFVFADVALPAYGRSGRAEQTPWDPALLHFDRSYRHDSPVPS